MDPLIESLVLEARECTAKGDWLRTEVLVDEILTRKPTSQKGLQLRAFVLYQKEKFQETINAISEVIANTKPLLMNFELLGNCYMRTKQYQNAREIYDKILDMDPSNDNAHIELAYIHLLKERWEEGWHHYEFRYSKANQDYIKLLNPAKAWDGFQSLDNKTIVLYCEQGYGDFIQFIRYAHFLSYYTNKVYVEVQDELRPLFESMQYHGKLNLVNRPFDIEHDFHCSIMSLPYFLGLNPEEYKGKVPYIRAKKFELPEEYKNNFKVGIAWTGSPLNPTQDHRSCTLDDFLKLVDIENVKLFSLQKDISIESSHIIDMSGFMGDFAETAKIIEEMDLIITVDTCILHLAGAMNKDCWGLMSYYADWRWGEKISSLWYDSVSLFRQKEPKKWDSVFESIKSSLYIRSLER